MAGKTRKPIPVWYISQDFGKTMKSEAEFEYRSEAYDSTPARNGKFSEEFAFCTGHQEPVKTMKSEAGFEYRRETYWQVR